MPAAKEVPLAMPTLVRYTWRNVKSLYSPPETRIQRVGVKRSLTQCEVSLDLDPRADLSEIREWLETNTRGRFRMFGHYLRRRKTQLRDAQSVYVGVIFSFDDIKDAIHFKLRWFGNEPTVAPEIAE